MTFQFAQKSNTIGFGTMLCKLQRSSPPFLTEFLGNQKMASESRSAHQETHSNDKYHIALYFTFSILPLINWVCVLKSMDMIPSFLCVLNLVVAITKRQAHNLLHANIIDEIS